MWGPTLQHDCGAPSTAPPPANMPVMGQPGSVLAFGAFRLRHTEICVSALPPCGRTSTPVWEDSDWPRACACTSSPLFLLHLLSFTTLPGPIVLFKPETAKKKGASDDRREETKRSERLNSRAPHRVKKEICNQKFFRLSLQKSLFICEDILYMFMSPHARGWNILDPQKT